MATEYRFDYSKAKPNRFASRMKDGPLVAVIDPDVAKVFTTSEQCSGPQKLDTTLRGRMENQERGPVWQGNAGISMWHSKRE